MNYRTLTDNKQVAELINAVKDLKPVEQQDYKGSMEYLQADSASYAALIAKYGVGQEPPKDWRIPEIPGEFVAFSAFITGLIFVFALVYGLCKSHKK